MTTRMTGVIDRLTAQAEAERGDRTIPPQDRMLAITPDTGKFFEILLRDMGARDILEVGTSVGYSTLWMARAVAGNGGRITTIEQNPSKVARAKKNFAEAGTADIIQIKEGNALDVLPLIRSEFDFCLLDADKENLAAYFDLVLPRMRKNGIIAIDNMLYPEKFRPMMEEVKRHIESCPGVGSATVPIGNGQEIVQVLQPDRSG